MRLLNKIIFQLVLPSAFVALLNICAKIHTTSIGRQEAFVLIPRIVLIPLQKLLSTFMLLQPCFSCEVSLKTYNAESPEPQQPF